MNIWIALLRGINVGGKNVLKMRDLVAVLEVVGCSDVRTHIQSGNAVFRSAESDATILRTMIENAIRERRGIEARALVLGVEELKEAMDSNPFPQAEDEPSKLHLFFLSEPPQSPDIESINVLKADSELFVLTDKVFYLHAPDGIGRSKLAARVENLLGVDATARNWRTVSKVGEMAQATANQ